MDCIIPARGGSKGIPKKNIALLHQIPLIAYSIFIAKKSKQINKIYVSTDSEEIAEISRFYGAETPFLRPAYLATDKANDREVFDHFFKEAKKVDLQISRDIVHLRATSPCRKENIIDKAITYFYEDSACTSLRSAHQTDLHPHKWFNLRDGYFSPLIKSTTDIEVTNMPRQSFPPVFIPNGYVDIVRFSTFKYEGKFHGEKTKSFITDPVIDIDKPLDLEKAKDDKQIILLSREIEKEYP